MYKYSVVFRQSLLDAFEYRFDLFMHLFKYAVTIAMMGLVWLAVAKENPNLAMTPKEITSYYIVASILYSLTNFHTDYVEIDIQRGLLTRLLVKPISVFVFYFTFQSAIAVFEAIIKLVIFIPLLVYLGNYFQVGLGQIIFFTVFLVLSFLLSFSLYYSISLGSLWIYQIWSIRFSVLFLVRLLSGMLVPLSFFPSWYQTVSFYLPFEHMVFTPIQIVMGKIELESILQSLLVLFFWTIVITYLRTYVWRKAQTAYEGSGI